jgi:hypothetical protein
MPHAADWADPSFARVGDATAVRHPGASATAGPAVADEPGSSAGLAEARDGHHVEAVGATLLATTSPRSAASSDPASRCRAAAGWRRRFSGRRPAGRCCPRSDRRRRARQTDIGDAVKPYYGRRAGNRLTALLKEHIADAVELLKAAKGRRRRAFASAKTAWYTKGRQIARLLSRANPRFLPFTAVNPMMMKGHPDQTLAEAAHRLGADFAADIRHYEHIQAPHPADGRRDQQRNHEAVPAPLPLTELGPASLIGRSSARPGMAGVLAPDRRSAQC